MLSRLQKNEVPGKGSPSVGDGCEMTFDPISLCLESVSASHMAVACPVMDNSCKDADCRSWGSASVDLLWCVCVCV